MAKRTSWRLASALVALAIALVFVVRSFLDTGVGASGEFGISTVDEATRAASTDAPAPATLTPIPTAVSEAPTIAESSTPELGLKKDRSAAATPAELELGEAVWVSGRVIFPEHTPIGETVEVIANGKKFKHQEMHRAAVASDGSFRVAFAKGTKSGRLTIDAPHLFVRETPAIKPASAPSGHVLEPELGGRILGVVIPPDGVADVTKELEDASIGLFSWDSVMSERVQRSSKIGSDLRFELRGVPTNARCQVHSTTKYWTRASIDDARVNAGADESVELRFKRGVQLKGMVVDEAGQPLPMAFVAVQVERTDEQGGSTGSSESSGKEGTFDLRGQEPGKVTLTAQKTGYLDTKLELGALSEGDVREGIELRLAGGAFVAGRVLWPDGKPVVKAFVSADPVQEEDSESWFPGQDQRVKTGEDGSFKIAGLKAGAVNLGALATARDESKAGENASAAAAEAGALKKSARKAKWTARLENVMPGNDSVVLTLQPGYAVSGRVVDDTGAPVKRFSVVATAAESEAGDSTTILDTVTARSSTDDGDFTLEGLEAGAWQVEVKAKGYQSGAESSIVVPDMQTLGTLVVARASILRGIVLAPNGTPLARAMVQVSLPNSDPMFQFEMNFNGTARSDSKGAFEIKSGPAGPCTLTATFEGFAQSEPLLVNAGPGQTLEGLSLTLRGGGRLTIQLMSSTGAKVAGRAISLYLQDEHNDWKEARTNSSGLATVEGLTPGEWRVSADPTEEEVQALGETDGEEDWQLRSSLQKSATVSIVDGDTAHVVLGAPPRAPVEVTGVVRSGGSPIAGARVQAFLHGEGSIQKYARCDSKGAYRMTLDQPGSYSFTANPDGVESTQWKRVEIPESAAFTFDIDLPTGSISGRVIGPDGAPLAEASVQLALDRSKAERRSDHVGGWVQTDESGNFRFENLPPGSYTIAAEGESARGLDVFGGSSRNAPVVFSKEAVRDLELPEGGALRDIEIRLAVGGTLQGIVRDSEGRPADEAFVLVRDASGRTRNDLGANTDETGRYELAGLPAGNWTVRAMRQTEISNEVAVRIVANETTQAELQLRAGTRLTIETFESDGTAVGASISVLDAQGQEAGVWREQGATASSWTAAPLPSGEYTITATNHDGVSVSTSITISGEATKSVRLTFGQ